MRAFMIAISAFCLVCIGVHAAADRVDDVITAGVERIDTVVDAIVSVWSLTRPLADWIDAALIVKVSRSVALVWELATSLLLVASVFAYERRMALQSKTAARDLKRALRELRLRMRRDGPRILSSTLRPVCTLAFVLAGSGAIARTVHGSVMLATNQVLGAKAASVLGRVLGGTSLVSTFIVLGLPAIAASFVNAKEQGTFEVLFPRTWKREIAVLTLVLPLAWFALQAGVQLGGMLS